MKMRVRVIIASILLLAPGLFAVLQLIEVCQDVARLNRGIWAVMAVLTILFGGLGGLSMVFAIPAYFHMSDRKGLLMRAVYRSGILVLLALTILPLVKWFVPYVFLEVAFMDVIGLIGMRYPLQASVAGGMLLLYSAAGLIFRRRVHYSRFEMPAAV
ncbi:hypothetical protein [Spirochaeta dissipatitropha]